MHNGTRCALKLHAKSQYIPEVICANKESRLVRPFNRMYFLESCGCGQRFAGLPLRIAACFSATRHYVARWTR